MQELDKSLTHDLHQHQQDPICSITFSAVPSMYKVPYRLHCRKKWMLTFKADCPGSACCLCCALEASGPVETSRMFHP